ncbi:MAG: HAD family hydrolase [Myxococcaceae bacterium]
MAIAFFDLDKTLLAANSATLWVRRELALGNLRRREGLQAAVWLGLYQLGFAGLDILVARAIATIAGTREEDVRERTERFYREEVRLLYRPGAMAALERHRARGDRLVLLTSSSEYLSRCVAEELRLDDILCNRFEVDESGRHTGRALGMLCFGAGKLGYARAYAAGARAELRDCAFYTDSFSDLSVLEQVGHPVAVNPDVRLRRFAGRQGWQIVDWGKPA